MLVALWLRNVALFLRSLGGSKRHQSDIMSEGTSREQSRTLRAVHLIKSRF